MLTGMWPRELRIVVHQVDGKLIRNGAAGVQLGGGDAFWNAETFHSLARRSGLLKRLVPMRVAPPIVEREHRSRQGL